MERWNVQNRVSAVQHYIRTDSIIQTQRAFRAEYGCRNAPSDKSIRKWVRKWRETGSVCDRSPPGPNRTVRTPENIAAIQAAVVRSPQRSTRRLAQAVGTSRTTVRRILRMDLKFHPYKLLVVQKLTVNDPNARTTFCRRLLELRRDDPTFADHFIMSDEAHFLLCGEVNKQNTRYWSAANSHVLHDKPLHSEKIAVWCGVCSQGILGPYVFKNERGFTTTITSERYVEMLRTFLPGELARFHLNESSWFQQDAATPHTARISMAVLQNLFPGRIMSRFGDVAFSPRSPDLTVQEFSYGDI